MGLWLREDNDDSDVDNADDDDDDALLYFIFQRYFFCFHIVLSPDLHQLYTY